MSIDSKKPKMYSQCFLFKSNVYETKLLNYIKHSEELDKNSDKFFYVLNSFKHSYPKWLYKFVASDRCAFFIPNKSFPVVKAFNAFAITKGNGKNQHLAIINAHLLNVHLKSNAYVLNSNTESAMLGYSVSAATHYTYLVNPTVYTSNSKIVVNGGESFARLVNHILHYVYKINSIPKLKEKTDLFSKIYFYRNLMNFDMEKSLKLAKRDTNVSEHEIAVLNADEDEAYENIDVFINNVLAKLPGLEKLTTAIFVEKWIQLYGVGTEFAMELLPPFLTLFTNLYVSSYTCNINLIQSVTGKVNSIGQEVMTIGGRIYG